jgi:cytochrome c553
MKRLGILMFAGAALALGTAWAQVAPTAGAPHEGATHDSAIERYRDLRRIKPVLGDARAGQAKSELCAACHGDNGVAVSPIAPNLAGQHADYMYWELVEYNGGAMAESAMTPLAASLSDADMRDLAAYYASLPAGRMPVEEGTPPPDPAVLSRGEQLFTTGDSAKGIPPCQGCHGADAKGYPLAAQTDRNGYAPWAMFPALRGQNPIYLQARLTEFRDNKLHHSSTDFVMSNVGKRLDDGDITALSTWLSEQAP